MVPILLLHITVVLLAFVLAQLGTRNCDTEVFRRFNIAYITSFLILLVFLGCRVSLGRDWLTYESIFSSNIQQEFMMGESREIGFLLLVQFLRFFDLEFQSFIFVTSFFILLLFYSSYRKFYFLLPFGIFVFFTDWGYTVTINTIRQGIALMAFLNASLYIDSTEKRAGAKFLFFVFIGFLFHYSILAFLPFYYIGRLKIGIVSFLTICLAIAIVSFFLIMPLYEDAITMVDKYEHYNDASYIVNENSSFGIGATLVLFIRLCPLLIYEYIRKNDSSFLKFFVLYYIGLSVYYGFFKFMLITRVTFYLQFFELFVMAYFIYYLFVEKKHLRLFGLGYVFLILFNYVYTFQDFLVDQLVSSEFSLMFIDFYYHI